MSTHHSHQSYDDLTRGNHEEDAIDFAGILKVGAGLVVVTVFSYLVVWGVYGILQSRTADQTAERRYPLSVAVADRLPPDPRLQTNPKKDLADLRAYEADTLAHYAWVDKNNGVARIPIENAMKLVLERGLPARPATAAVSAAAAATPETPAPAAAPAPAAEPAHPQEHR